MSDADDILNVLSGRLRDEDSIAEATRVQDELRAKSGSWSGEVAREWRRNRYSS